MNEMRLSALFLLCQGFLHIYEQGDTEVFSREWWRKPFGSTNIDFELGSIRDEVSVLLRWIGGAHEIPKAEFTDLVICANVILKRRVGHGL